MKIYMKKSFNARHHVLYLLTKFEVKFNSYTNKKNSLGVDWAI
jgi:hypothetical protein